MPNRKPDPKIGWYKLPRSGHPYYGPVPDGAETLTPTQAEKAAKHSGSPATDQQASQPS